MLVGRSNFGVDSGISIYQAKLNFSFGEQFMIFFPVRIAYFKDALLNPPSVLDVEILVNLPFMPYGTAQ